MIALITLIVTIHLSYSFGALNQTETLSSVVCQNLVKGQNATESFVASTCIISASTRLSPFFLTNFTTILIIPAGSGLTLNSGFGFANYGEINNSGVITQKVPFINY